MRNRAMLPNNISTIIRQLLVGGLYEELGSNTRVDNIYQRYSGDRIIFSASWLFMDHISDEK